MQETQNDTDMVLSTDKMTGNLVSKRHEQMKNGSSSDKTQTDSNRMVRKLVTTNGKLTRLKVTQL